MLERQSTMTNNQQTAWIDALRYITNADDAPDTARHDCRLALLALDASNDLRNREHLSTHQALQKLRTREHANIPQVIDQLRNGTPTDLDADVQQLEQLHNSLATAQRRALIADNVHRSITNQICGGVLRPHQQTLLHWIAQRRNAQPFDCGTTPTLPNQLQLIYDLISPQWSANWEQLLDLDQSSFLPVIYSAEWTTQRRASLAWVWEQLALGLVQWIDDGDAFADVLVPINKPTALPDVPAVPPLALQN
jgi:hypothetical protein